MTQQLRIELSQDRQSASLQINGPDTPMNAQEISQLIAALAQIRASMTPEVPTHIPPPGEKVPLTNNPNWYTEPDHFSQCSKLFLRHPGIGWLAFHLPLAEAAKLSSLLAQQPSAIDQESSNKKPN